MSNKNLPIVSIGIPTYNRADGYLREALQSALDQSYGNIEVIVSDNCSTDGTEHYVRNIGTKHIRYFKQPVSLIPNANFNFCLNHARGSYFLLLHDDDKIDNDFVSMCMHAANHSPDYALIRTGTRIIDAQSKIVRNIQNLVTDSSPAGLCRAWFNNQISFYFCSTLFNTALLKAAGGLYSKHNLLEDCNAIIELSTRGKRIDIGDVKASYREHSNYLAYGLIVKKWAEDFLWLLDRICALNPNETSDLKSEGTRFFASLSYKRAKVVASPLKRLIANLTVFRLFGYRYVPPQFQLRNLANLLRHAKVKTTGH